MKCPTKDELVFSIINGSQVEEDNSRIRSHLRECKKCRAAHAMLEMEIKQMTRENVAECDQVRSLLVDFQDGLLDEKGRQKVQEHLSQCDGCNFLHQLLRRPISLEEAEKINYPVPERLHQAVKALVSEAAPSDAVKMGWRELLKPIYEAMDKIIVILSPAPQPVFLGDHLQGAQSITISRRDMAIYVGRPGLAVKLFSNDGQELASDVSNEAGMVIFKDFFADTYKLIVQGYEIKGIKTA